MVRGMAGGGHLLGVNGTRYDWKGVRSITGGGHLARG